MWQIINKIIPYFFNITIALIFTITFLLPDYLSHFFIYHNFKILNWSLNFAFFAFALIITTLEKKLYVAIIFILLGTLHLAQLLHVAYFGTEIMPEIIIKVMDNPVEDFHEIYLATMDSLRLLYRAFLIIIGCYGIGYFIYYKCSNYLIKVPYIGIICLCGAATFAFQNIQNRRTHFFYPNIIKPSLYNALNSFFVVFNSNKFFDIKENLEYIPYQIIKSHPKAQNIIVIMGESCREDYMSLFGFKYKTTPLLDQKKELVNFIFKPGISSGVSTDVALQKFFNVIYEPNNVQLLTDKSSNLMHLAKAQGYNVVLISMQTASLFAKVGLGYVDKFLSKESFDPELITLKRDELLLDELKKIKFEGKNLIILHQRAIHTPYKDNYKHKPELALFSEAELDSTPVRMEYERKVYANAMRFNDYILSNIIDYLDNKLKDKGENYIFFTSDHGELLGEDNLYGHHHLNIQTAKVPFIVFGINADNKFLQNIDTKNALTHYDFGLLIADRMGVEIVNQNKKDGIYYIQGCLYHNKAPYLSYKLEEAFK